MISSNGRIAAGAQLPATHRWDNKWAVDVLPKALPISTPGIGLPVVASVTLPFIVLTGGGMGPKFTTIRALQYTVKTPS